MKTRITSLLAIVLYAVGAIAQTNQGASNFPQINSTLYVGAVPGFYPTIQAAVTKGCTGSAGAKRIVSIPAAYAGTDTITAVTGSCTTTWIVDDRALPRVCYNVSSAGAVYASTPCSGSSGGGITALTGDGTASGTGSVPFTLASVSTPGSYSVGGTVITIDIKGRVLAIGPPFSLGISCSAAGNFEIGYASTNPNTCSFTYANGTPASATLSDGVHSTVNLTSPYSTGVLPYVYTANTNFNAGATATNAQTATAGAGIAFFNCTFQGLSTGGTATGATASGSGAGNQCASETVTLSGITGTLTSKGLGNTFAGQSFTFPSPGGSYLTLLLTGGCGHTLTIGGFTTTFNTFALTYNNILGGAQTGMCAYTSPAPASLSSTVVVQSL